MTEVEVVVVGTGLAGLFVASELQARGVDDLVVLGADPAVGGIARTIHTDGYTLEPAVGTLSLPHPHLSPIVARSGVSVTPARSGHRFVYTGGRLLPVRPSPRLLFSPIVGWRGRGRVIVEPFVRTAPPAGDESLTAFLSRRLGPEAGAMAGWLAAGGVYAGNPDELSVRASFPALAALEQRHGSLFAGVRHARRKRRPGTRPIPHVVSGGVAALAEAIRATLADRVRSNAPVDSVRREGDALVVDGVSTIRARSVVVATSPGDAAAILSDPSVARLDGARSAPVTVTWLGGPADDIPGPDGFGVLCGPDPKMSTRGILFESSFDPSRAPRGMRLLKAISGGSANPAFAGRPEAEIVERVTDEVGRMLGRTITPTFTRVVRHFPGIPQYPIGHLDWIASIERGLPSGVHLAGWGYRGVGVSSLASDAVRIANEVAAR